MALQSRRYRSVMASWFARYFTQTSLRDGLLHEWVRDPQAGRLEYVEAWLDGGRAQGECVADGADCGVGVGAK